MKILVTGSEGNIGKKLVPYLKEKGNEVMGCDITPKFADDYILCDICNVSDLISLFRGFIPDVVINLAAMYGRITCEKSPAQTIDVNVAGVNNIIQLCKEFKSKFIYFSSSEVYGNSPTIKTEDSECKPNNIYGLSKWLGEQLVRYEMTNGLVANIIRPFTIYDEDETIGKHRSAIIRFAEQLYKKNKIEVYLNSTRSWLHVSDAVVIIEKVLHLENETINIGTSEVIDIKDVAKIMCDELFINYGDYVVEKELPGKMSLEKTPDLTKQTNLGFAPQVKIKDGLERVIEKIRTRL